MRYNALQMKLLFIFLDGVGLGADDATINPFAVARMPNLHTLLGGQRLTAANGFLLPANHLRTTARATLLALDACLGVDGIPQSATGQATLLTGINISAAIGYHYGPKPNPPIAEFVRNGSLFQTLHKGGRKAALLNAYPPSYFTGVRSGRRLFSAIPLAVESAGIPLKAAQDLFAGQAISADFTGQGWRDRLGIAEAPVLSVEQAGERLAALAQEVDFSFFEYWPSDYAGHGQDMGVATSLLETFDRVLGGVLSVWDDQSGLILITSDHGNLEDLSTRRHTRNPVPALVIGEESMRGKFTQDLKDLTHVAGAILKFVGVDA